MTSKIRKLITFLFIIFVSFIIALSIIYSIFYQKLHQYKPVIEEKISQYFGYAVTIENVDISFSNFDFAIKLDSLLIRDNKINKELLYSKEVKATLNLWQTLIKKEIIITAIYFNGLESSLNRDFVDYLISSVDQILNKNNIGNKNIFNEFKIIKIKNSNINYINEHKKIIPINNLYLNAEIVDYNDFFVTASAIVNDNKEEINFKLKFKGDYQDLANSEVEIKLYSDYLEIEKFVEIFPDLIKFENSTLENFDFDGIYLKSKLQNLIISSTLKKIPIDNDNIVDYAVLNLNYNNNNIKLKIEDLKLSLNKLFNKQLAIKEMQGNINLLEFYIDKNLESLKDIGFKIKSDDFKVKLNGYELKSPFDLAKKQSDYIYNFKFNSEDNILIEDALVYIPDSLIPEVAKWLNDSLLTGVLKKNKVSISNNNIYWQTNFSNITMKYDEKWPEVNNLSGELVIDNKQMKIKSDKAEIIGVKVKDIFAAKEDLIDKNSPLIINAQIESNLSKGMDFLKLSPLKHTVGDHIFKLNPEGDMNLDLKLTLDFSQDVEVIPFGNLRIFNANIVEPDWDINISDLQGDFSFTENSFSGENLSFSLFGEKAKGKLNFIDNEKSDFNKYLIINFDSSIAIDFLSKKYIEDLSKFAKGRTNYNADLKIATVGNKNMVNLTVESDLTGVDILAPSPFYKSKNDKIPLILDIIFNEKNKINLNIIDLFNSLCLLSDEKIEKCHINFGKNKKVDLPKNNMILIGGDIEELNLSEWLVFNEKKSIEIDLPIIIELMVDKINIFDNHFSSVWIRHEKDSDQLEFDGSKIKGIVKFDVSKNKISGDFDYLYLDTKDSNYEKIGYETVDFKNLPTIDFNSKSLYINNRNLGSLSFNLLKFANGYRINNLFMGGDDYAFNGNGTWDLKNNKTSINGKAKVDNFGALFSRMGYSATVKRGVGDININMAWMDNPFNFKLSETIGNIEFSAKNGALLGVDPGIGKILGLLSLESISRRLRLDFSDIFEKGFSFDIFSGDIELNRNLAKIENVLIDGPAARIEILGTTKVSSKELDLNMSVTPKLDSGIPVAAAIATGHPAIGAAVFFFDKILQGNINSVSQHRYKISGTWNNPKIAGIKEIKPQTEKK